MGKGTHPLARPCNDHSLMPNAMDPSFINWNADSMELNLPPCHRPDACASSLIHLSTCCELGHYVNYSNIRTDFLIKLYMHLHSALTHMQTSSIPGTFLPPSATQPHCAHNILHSPTRGRGGDELRSSVFNFRDITLFPSTLLRNFTCFHRFPAASPASLSLSLFPQISCSVVRPAIM